MNNAQAAAEGSYAAALLHGELRLAADEPVDVFRVAQDRGLWLRPGPLGKGQYGFYLREGVTAGIFINSNHPEPTQRFTCAHELGHHVLGHSSHFDGADAFGPGVKDNEAAAQAFASNFMMPYIALNRTMRRVGVATRGAPITSADAYAAALALDVSYSALVWHLRASQWLTLDQARELTHRRVLANTKAALAPPPLIAPSTPTVDVRTARVQDDKAIRCRAGDDLLLDIDENPSTGYRWDVDARSDGVEIRGLAYRSAPTPDDEYGTASVRRVVHVRAIQPGRHWVTLAHREPWSRDSVATRVTVWLDALPRSSAQALFGQQTEQHAVGRAA
jgi:Zn-dependent peptidase ImmA (M78 family)/predicted secreted protein